jgi:hypothetical protein
MAKILEQIEDFLVKVQDMTGGEEHLDVDLDEEIFNKMVDLIITLDPETLSEPQLEMVMEIIELFEPSDEDIEEARFLKKTTRKQRKQAKIYRRRNRTKIKQYRRKNRVKLARARRTGRGLTGKRRGRYKRRSGGPR